MSLLHTAGPVPLGPRNRSQSASLPVQAQSTKSLPALMLTHSTAKMTLIPRNSSLKARTEEQINEVL